MSYFNFIACSRKIECGEFISPPDKIYPSYSAYRESEDYRIHQSLTYKDCSRCYMTKGPKEPEKAVGSVHVYTHIAKCLRIVNMTDFPLKPDEAAFITAQFTQPYKYMLLYKDLFLEHVCQYLNPGDKMEFLSIFLRHGAPLVAPARQTINLQPYAECKISLEAIWRTLAPYPANNFTSFIVPMTPLPVPNIVNMDATDRICKISPHIRGESWNLEELEKQGLL